MLGTDGRVFSSFVAAAIVATDACGSVRERIVRRSCISLFQDAKESIQRSMEVQGRGTMELLGLGGYVVGTRILQENIKCGMQLNAVKLGPFEVVVQVVRVIGESVWTGEIVEEQLEQCIGSIIRWRRADVRSVSGGMSSIGESGARQNFSFPSLTRSDFEFEDGDTCNGDSSDPPHRKENSSGTRSMSPMTKASQCTRGSVPVLHGLPTVRQSRRYSMHNR